MNSREHGYRPNMQGKKDTAFIRVNRGQTVKTTGNE
jgi:hypothetical protein